jgi:diguanylate cyclase (GGDEF)-like protein
LSTPIAPEPTDTAAHEALLQFLYRAPIGLVQADAQGQVEIMNPMAASLLMPLSGDAGLENLFDALAPLLPDLKDRARAVQAHAGMVCEGLRLSVASGEGGRPRAQVIELSLLKLDPSRFMASLTDVTQEVERAQRGLARKLRDVALTDALTGLPNREAVCEQVNLALSRPADETSGQFAVVFMNCDRFKQVNDTLGHAAGDALLKMMADRFRATLRQRDQRGETQGAADLAGRVGGDEFVVLLEGLRSAEDVHAVARRLLDVLGRPYELGGHVVCCSISMGIVTQALAKADAKAVVQDASIAMAEAKRAGGNRHVVFEPEMGERAARRGSIESDLRAGLAAGQLHVVYQPVVALRERGQIDAHAGVEALVRWHHPVRGMVPPLEFIGVAEECGLIDEIGRFVLSTACADFVRWRADLGACAPRRLAVNLSRAQLADAELPASVQAILRDTGMPASALQLEVTESLAAQDEGVQQRLRELKALGLTLALDDFGTGYSSLASLHLLPVDTVKIDRSFVSQVCSSHHHQVLIEATVKVARSLGMGTVAEGIETAEQADMVAGLGCQKGQGYLFSRPLPNEALQAWLRAAPPVPFVPPVPPPSVSAPISADPCGVQGPV